MIKRFLILMAVVLAWVPVASAQVLAEPPQADPATNECEGPWQVYEGFEAHDARGDWDAMFALLYPCAEAGYAQAQLGMGFMFKYGMGVTQEDEQAFYWLWLAAEQGADMAQLYVGEAYGTGVGVERNLVLALMYFNLASSGAGIDLPYWHQESPRALIEEFADKRRNEVAALLTALEIVEATLLTREWQQEHRR